MNGEILHRIGLDRVVAYCDYPGRLDLHPELWRKWFYRKHEKQNPAEKVSRYTLRNHYCVEKNGIFLLVLRHSMYFHRFLLFFNPNRLKHLDNPDGDKHSQLLQPAMPEDAEHILSVLENTIYPLVPVIRDEIPFRSEAWTVSGIDLNVDMDNPHPIFNAIIRGMRSIGLQYGQNVRDFHYKEHFDPEKEIEEAEIELSNYDPEIAITGLKLRNGGKKRRYEHAFYQKKEEGYFRDGERYHHLSPDSNREEVRFRGKDMLQEIGLIDRSILSVLQFPDRAAGLLFMMRKHGVSVLPKPYQNPFSLNREILKESIRFSLTMLESDGKPELPHHFTPFDVIAHHFRTSGIAELPPVYREPLQSILPDSRPSILRLYEAKDSSGRSYLQHVLAKRFDNANAIAVQNGYEKREDRSLQNLRRKCFNHGLFMVNPLDNALLLLYLSHIIYTSNGCSVSFPNWQHLFAPCDIGGLRQMLRNMEQNNTEEEPVIKPTVTANSLSKPLFELNLDRITHSPHRSEKGKHKVTPIEHSQRAPP